MEKEKAGTKIIAVCYKEHCRSEEEWLYNVNNDPSIVAVYMLNCGKCGREIWGEMERDGETISPHFFNYYNRQETITSCPKCEVELDLNDPWLAGGVPKLEDAPAEIIYPIGIIWPRGIRIFLDHFTPPTK